jgi:glycosyltransferase involved in cell wall biosynthesis
MGLVEQKVSVIVPVYNCQQYLNECIESILGQTLKNIEIICVNDGSQDNSQTILEDYQRRDNRIRIVNKKNGGLSSARNVGMKIATGEYIGFVDSDDWIDADFFEKLYNQTFRNKAEMAMGNVEIFPAKLGRITALSWISSLIKEIKSDNVVTVPERKKIIATSSVCNKLFKREFLSRNEFHFFEGLYWEDNPFTVMTTIKANSIYLVRDVYYHYRNHPESITVSAYSDRKSFDIFEIMDRLRLFFEKEHVDEIDGYKHYFAELMAYFFMIQFEKWVPGRYQKEFFHRMNEYFQTVNNDSLDHLCMMNGNVTLIRNNHYLYYKFKVSAYKMFRTLFGNK